MGIGAARSAPPPSLVARVGSAPTGYLYVSLDGDLLEFVVDAIQGLVD